MCEDERAYRCVISYTAYGRNFNTSKDLSVYTAGNIITNLIFTFRKIQLPLKKVLFWSKNVASLKYSSEYFTAHIHCDIPHIYPYSVEYALFSSNG